MSKPAAKIVEEGIALVQCAGLRVDATESGGVQSRMRLKDNGNRSEM